MLNDENTANQGINQPENMPTRGGEALAFVWETIKLVAISLAIIIPIRYYLVQPFFVKGASMEDNFHDGDYLLIDEISYRFNDPRRGDVVVFRYPENPSQYYIKRIIGLPGETIDIENDKVTIYNGETPEGVVLNEDYLSDFQKTFGDERVTLEEDEFFVMGDNRLQSSDSRRWGSVNKSLIVGRAFIRLWPFTRITKVEAVTY